MEYQRVAFAANLTRAADVLDRVAAQAAVADLPKQESLEEMQAQIKAVAAIWGATIAGFLTIPEIKAEVDGLADSGLTEPDSTRNSGADCANLFFAVMREFVYPQGEAVAPYYALIEDERWTPTELEYRMLRKNELRAEATGCRMLAQIITGSSGGSVPRG
ncbi:MAG: hypothetical protein K8R46_04590 [Pirellulales bacterium]|nr:hypothetical protein [Pirellulales bacterium]